MDSFTWEELDANERAARTVQSEPFIEALSARLHDIYQKEAHRRGDVRHADAYEDLADATKEWDRVLARWIIRYFTPSFPPDAIPPP
jgi:hypothetical protein